MEERERRVVENEAKFRLVNERIQAIVRSDEALFGEPIEEITIICECGVKECTETVGLPLSAYEWTRAESARFAVAVGHSLPGYERVVRAAEGYTIVEKLGEARGAASDLDPNAR